MTQQRRMVLANRRSLDQRADYLERLLTDHDLGNVGRIGGGVVGPHWVQLKVYNTGSVRMRWDRVQGLRNEIADALDVDAESVDFSKPGYIRIERDPRYLTALLFMARRLPKVPASTAILGHEIGNDGAPVLARLESDNVNHILMYGANTRELMIAALLSLTLCHTPDQLRIAVGPHDRALEMLRGLPHFLDMSKLPGIYKRRDYVRDRDPVIVCGVGNIEGVGVAPFLRDGPARGIHLIAGVHIPIKGECLRIFSAGMTSAETIEVTGGAYNVDTTGLSIGDYMAAETLHPTGQAAYFKGEFNGAWIDDNAAQNLIRRIATQGVSVG